MPRLSLFGEELLRLRPQLFTLALMSALVTMQQLEQVEQLVVELEPQ